VKVVAATATATSDPNQNRTSLVMMTSFEEGNVLRVD
jgi:hypothetical protein